MLFVSPPLFTTAETFGLEAANALCGWAAEFGWALVARREALRREWLRKSVFAVKPSRTKKVTAIAVLKIAFFFFTL